MRTALMIAGIIVLLIAYVTGVVFFRRYRAWLAYYLLGAFGLTLILVFGAQAIGLAGKIESLVTYGTTWLASLVGIKSQWLGQSQFMVADRSGWVVLQTNIECSALIESSILAGLIFFYPAFDVLRKIRYFTIGLVVTIVANTLRMLIITGMTATLGRGAVFWGHAIVGRLFFFAIIIALYWFILTRPTVHEVAKLIGEGKETKDQRSLGVLLASAITLVLLAVMGVFILVDIPVTRQETSHSAAGHSRSVTRTKVADESIRGIRADELTSAINVKDGQLVGTSEFKARLSSNETYLEFRYEGQLFSITTVPAGFKKVAGKAQRETITFKGVMAGTDLSQKLYVRRLKEEIKLLSSQAPTTFRFTISPSDNLILEKNRDYLTFFRQTDHKELARIEQPYAVDKRGVKYPYRYELKGETLTLKPASSLAGAVYPLVIDPSYLVVATSATSSPTESNTQRKLARSSNGDLHSVYWRNNGTDNIMYAKSTNNGVTWTETALTSAGGQYKPAIAIDSNNDLHVVWTGTYNTKYNIGYREYTGGSWAATTWLTTDSTYDQYSPKVAVDSSNNLHVFWGGRHSGSTTYVQQRYLKYTVGSGWDASPTNLTSDSYDNWGGGFAVDSSNNLHAIFYGGTTYSQIRYLKYTVGTGWDASPTSLTTGNYNQFNASIAVDSSDNLHVVWHGDFSGSTYYEIRYKKYTVGTGWDASPTNLTSDSYQQYNPSIAVDASNNLHVVWYGQHSGSTTYSQIRYLKYTAGGSWDVSPTNLTSSATADQQYATLIWARWPVVSGSLTNRPKTGYGFIYSDGLVNVYYYASSDLLWDANTPEAALLAYGSVTVGSVAQKYRTYAFGVDWGGATNTPDTTHTTRWTVLKASPTTAGAYVMAEVTTEAASNFKVYSYYNGVWTSEFTYLQSSTQYAYRCFDVAYENTSGKVLVVYGKSGGGATQVYYREGTWNAGTLHYDWTVESSFTFNTSYLSGSLRWLVLANKLNYDEMILTAVGNATSGNSISAAIWGGAGFGTQNAVGWGMAGWLSATAPTNWDFDCAYETSSGNGMVAWGFYNTANPYWKYIRYTGGAWDAAVTNGPDPSVVLGGPIRLLSLASDPSPTSNLIACGITEMTAADVDGVVWNGSTPAWTGPTSLDTSVYGTSTGRQVDVCYAGTTGNAILVYDDSTVLTNLDWARSAGGGAFAMQAAFAEGAGSRDNNIQLVADASSDKIMFTRLDANSDIYAYYYTDGTTSWATTNGGGALEADSSGSTTRESYMFAFASVFRVPTLEIVLTIILVAGCVAIPVKRKILFIKRTKTSSRLETDV